MTDNLPAQISFVDAEQRYVFVNREYERVWGLPREKIIGRLMKDLFGLDNYNKVEKAIRQALAGQKNRFETAIVRRDGQTMWLDIHYIPYIDADGNQAGFYALSQDVTERKRSEDALRESEARFQQTQKFEALGTLASGMAHDFNNLLMGVQGNASLALIGIDSDHPLYQRLKKIETYIQRGADLTRQLLGLARGGKYEVKTTDLNELVQASATMFGRTKKEIQIQCDLEDGLWHADVDRGQIEQVLLNLFINAWHAMPDGGNLTISTANLILGEIDVARYSIAAGRYARVSVADTGCGIDPRVRSKIFDPFFTTKGAGIGTGLGLASAYGIIKNHHGAIDVNSEVGRGSVFFSFIYRHRKRQPRRPGTKRNGSPWAANPSSLSTMKPWSAILASSCSRNWGIMLPRHPRDRLRSRYSKSIKMRSIWSS